jgi:DNA-binding CsgD family transcriptional regulator
MTKKQLEVTTGINLPVSTKTLTTLISAQELKVINLVMTGASNDEISKQLNIAEKTVKFHLTRVFKKKSVSSRAQLMALEIRRLQSLISGSPNAN